MEAWLLFATETQSGKALRLIAVGEPSFGARAKRLSVWLEGRDSNQLRESAERGASHAYDILWGEKHLESSVDLTFRLDSEDPRLIRGNSCDLAFALAFVVSTLSRNNVAEFPPLAASGVLHPSGKVERVECLPAKVSAALRAIDEGGWIFYPSANDHEITSEVRLQARAQGVELRPVERLDEAIEALGIPLERLYLDSPFRGLEAFEYRHRSIFYGRHAESEVLVTRLIERSQAGRPGVLVIGDSGSGKSSFVQAGVLPALERWARRSDSGLDWTLWRPREVGVAGAGEPTLVASILRAWQGVPDLAGLSEPTTLAALADAYAQRWPTARKLVWVIDQLEELFTLGFEVDLIERLAQLLLTLQQRGAWVVGTLRADFYPEYQRCSALVTAFAGEGLFNLPVLADENLRQVIEEPVQAAGYGFEADASGVSLATRLLKEARDASDPLPLLQLVLAELYRHRSMDRRLLTWDAYYQLGGDDKEGLKAAVGKHAEAHFSLLPEAVRAALPRLLRALVTFGPKSAPLSRPAARTSVDQPHTRQLIDALLAPKVRLLAAEGDAATTRIRVAHEAVLTHWRRAGELIEQNRVDIQLKDRLHGEAQIWIKEGSPDDLLIPSGLRLTQAEDLRGRLGDELDTDVAKFIEVSANAEVQRREAAEAHKAAIEQERIDQANERARLAQEKVLAETMLRRRIQKAAGALAVLVLFTAGLGVVLYFSQQHAKEMAVEARALHYSTQARLLEATAPDESQLRSVAAYRTKVLPETEAAVRNAFAQGERLQRILRGHDQAVSHSAFSPDGKTVVTASNDNTARLWNVADGRTLATLSGHTGAVGSASFSPDGNTVVTASDDATARLWNVADGRPLATLSGHTDAVSSASFSPDGKTVVTASHDSTTRLWNAADGRPLATLLGHKRDIRHVAFSPDGKTMVTASNDNTARLWKAADGRPLAILFGHTEVIRRATFSPDSKTVVTASDDNTARLWSAADGRPLATLSGHTHYVRHAAFSPDGMTVVTASLDDTARLWNATDGRSLATLSGHNAPVRHAAFSPDGKTVVTASDDNTARLWNAADGRSLATLSGHTDAVDSASFSPDGNTVVTASNDNTARLWNAADGYRLAALSLHADAVGSASFSPDGNTVVTASHDSTARLWNAADGQHLATLSGHSGAVYHAAFSPDGKTVVTASNDNTARLWKAADGRPLAILFGHTEVIRRATFSPDSKTVVTASDDNTARLWSAADGRPLATLSGHTYPVVKAAFSPDAKTVVTASTDNTARLWNATDGRPLATLSGHSGAVFHASFSPDGKTVVTASTDGTARLWSAADGRPLAILSGHSFWIFHAAFSPDGKTVVTASADRTARLWNVADGQPLATLSGHTAPVNNAAFSRDGKIVVTASNDATARLWNADDGRPLATLSGHTDAVGSASFSPDGKTVVTASSDQTARLWRCRVCDPTDALVETIKSRLGVAAGTSLGS